MFFRFFWMALISYCSILTATAAEDPKTVGNVDGFLQASKGLISASDSMIQLGRSVHRLSHVRQAVTGALLAGKPLSEIEELKPEAILCNARISQVNKAADVAFIKAATGSVEKTATSSKIDGLGAAIGTIFSQYTIAVTDENVGSRKKIEAITHQCTDDLKNFGDVYYGLTGDFTAGITDFISPISALWDAITTIITPIATTVGQYVDDQKRASEVRKYLGNHRDQIADSVTRVSSAVNNFAYVQRMQSTGAFAEKMAAVRAISFDDLPDDCKSKLKTTPASPPSSEYMICYAKVWSKISDNLAAALKSADQYDQFADAGFGDPGHSDDLARSVIKQLDAAITPPKKDLPELWKDALKLMSFGQTIGKALSKSNRDAVQKAIDDLVKVF